MILQILSIFCYLIAHNTYAQNSSLGSNQSISSEPIIRETIIEEPNENPILAQNPEYNTIIKRTITYTNCDPNNLPKVKSKKTSPNHVLITVNQPKNHPKIQPSKQNHLFEDCTEFFTNNKYYILTGCGLLTYSALWLRLKLFSQIINNTDGWSCWKDEIPLEILYQKTPKEIVAELTDAIYKCYEIKDNLSDPILFFIKTVNREIHELERFIKFYKFLKLTLVAYILPSYAYEISIAQEKIDRLMHLKELIQDMIHERDF